MFSTARIFKKESPVHNFLQKKKRKRHIHACNYRCRNNPYYTLSTKKGEIYLLWVVYPMGR
uniref:Uncharacterized protein n=1 Tax=Anguilla anguilla TaxID=7936 RepID=A0A0E9QDM3_ANGAN